MAARVLCYDAAMEISRSRFVDVRGLRLHLREWGEEGLPRLYLLHGWMDASPSFQFVVDALAHDWHVIAPDWRGFGRSATGFRTILPTSMRSCGFARAMTMPLCVSSATAWAAMSRSCMPAFVLRVWRVCLRSTPLVCRIGLQPRRPGVTRNGWRA